jgi:hypothetical protein
MASGSKTAFEIGFTLFNSQNQSPTTNVKNLGIPSTLHFHHTENCTTSAKPATSKC